MRDKDIRKCCCLLHGTVVSCQQFRKKDRKGGRLDWVLFSHLGKRWGSRWNFGFWLLVNDAVVRMCWGSRQLFCCVALPAWSEQCAHWILSKGLLKKCPFFREVFCWGTSISWVGRGSLQSWSFTGFITFFLKLGSKAFARDRGEGYQQDRASSCAEEQEDNQWPRSYPSL